MKKTYIVVGDNNYWYHNFIAENQQEIDKALEFVKEQITKNSYNDLTLSKAEILYVYEIVSEFKTLVF